MIGSVLVLVVAVAGGAMHRGGHRASVVSANVAPSPAPSPATVIAPTTTVTDPAQGWGRSASPEGSPGSRGDPPGANGDSPAGARATAVAFARALLSMPPGAPAAAVVARCSVLVTPAFLAQLSSSPGAPSLRAAAQPVVVTGVAATLDDWAPGAAGVALGVVLHAGAHGPPSFVGLDVQVVAQAGGWRVDGMEM